MCFDMNEIIIAEGVGKKYMIRTSGAPRYRALRDEIMNIFQGKSQRKSQEEFWAIRDVGFTIKAGEKVGVIGKNGAGKSTLLKLLSRVTEPSTGQIKIKGRISSLLEVGTGFHPELTGRENIMLNGVILGMTRHEVKRNFEEIVDFAGVGKFLETQVKHYSSGMYMRLAFSVAAHLSPEILIIDEVLAVGDADFQKKCLGKMQDISQGGRTVIFVSHNTQSITSLCDRCLLLEGGRIKREGSTSEVILEYLGGGSAAKADYLNTSRVIGDEFVQLTFGEILNHLGYPVVESDIRNVLRIRMGFRVLRKSDIKYVPNLHFIVPGGAYAFISTPREPCEYDPGDYVVECELPGDFLNEGAYFVGLAMTSFSPGLMVHFYEESALTFNVRDSMEGSVARFGYVNIIPGVVRPQFRWTTERRSY